MRTYNQEISTFQFESEHILELEINTNHDLRLIKRNIFMGKPLTLIDVPPILIIIISREIIIVITTFIKMDSLT